ncbi:unnamed protein product [Sphagnum jensenii]|uniref:Mitochondrial thiamine pyrophosphate carrier n=1 Tax=Sphagnum jensenii TaxID=128206 RepID=A0ABP0WUT9_9BRYO
MQLRSPEGSSGSQKGEDVMEFQKSRGEQEQAQEQRQQRVKHRATVDAVAGAVAGGVSRTVVSPLDVIKIRFQVQLEPTSRHQLQAKVLSKYTGLTQAIQDIFREEGVVGFWRGNVPALLLVMPYTAIQFVVIEKFKTLASGSPREDEHMRLSPKMSFIGGSIAGTAATIGSYPFDLLRTILAAQGEPKVYPNLRVALVEILRTKGVTGLYAGLTPSLLEIVPYAGLQFGTYDALKRWTAALNRSRMLSGGGGDETLSGTQHFVCGLGAGLFAKLSCHPLDVVKKRFQVEGLARHPRYGAGVQVREYTSIWDAIQSILAKEGWRGLYKGTLPSVVKAAPAAAVTFVVYEAVIKWLTSLPV